MFYELPHISPISSTYFSLKYITLSCSRKLLIVEFESFALKNTCMDGTLKLVLYDPVHSVDKY